MEANVISAPRMDLGTFTTGGLTGGAAEIVGVSGGAGAGGVGVSGTAGTTASGALVAGMFVRLSVISPGPGSAELVSVWAMRDAGAKLKHPSIVVTNRQGFAL